MKHSRAINNLIFLIFISGFINLSHTQSTNRDNIPDVRQTLHEHKQRLFANGKAQAVDILASGQNHYDALYYRLNFKFSFEPNNLNGLTIARFEITSSAVDSILLNFDHTLSVTNVGGNANSFKHGNQLLTVCLDRTYTMGEIVEIEIEYQGEPAGGKENYFQFTFMPDGSPHIWTLSEPYGARYWWPCKDTPADKPDSVDIFITVPKAQIAASNGNLISVIDDADGLKTYHWQVRYPIATYLVSLAIGSYAQFKEYYHYGDSDSLLLDYYVYPERLEAAKLIFTEMHDYMDALTHYFGPYPFLNEKYGMAQFGWRGGMEHQTLTSIGYVTSSWRYLYVHELGHQWFGDAVTCASWTDIWLNEGFASYSEALYAEWAGFNGRPAGADSYHAYMNSQRYTGDRTIIVEDTTIVSNIFNRIVYDKGSWILHMLRGIMGDDVFFDVLKSYVWDPRWSYGSVRTADFQQICEEKSGLNLDAFFTQWLYYPYFPNYQYQWEVLSAVTGKATVELNINQTQIEPVYQMPVEITFEFFDETDTTFVVQNDSRSQSYLFILDQNPRQVFFDRNNWILRNVDETSTEMFTRDLFIKKSYPNPFNNKVTINVTNWGYHRAKLEIFDITGRKITELSPQYNSKSTEYYIWDGINKHGRPVSSGVYLIRPVINENTEQKIGKTQKIVFTK